jgi:hypothetical protein
LKKKNRPEAVVVSIASVRLTKPMPRSFRRRRSQEVFHAAAKTVQLPHDEGVAFPERIQRLGETGAPGLRAADRIVIDTIAPGALEGIELQIKVLVTGGDSGVAETVCTHVRVFSSQNSVQGPGSTVPFRELFVRTTDPSLQGRFSPGRVPRCCYQRPAGDSRFDFFSESIVCEKT